MRVLRVALPTAALLACASQVPTELQNRRPPATLSVAARTRVVYSAGQTDLEVAATLRNTTTLPIRVTSGVACPLSVRLVADPTGQQVGTLDGSMACAVATPALDLAPGDSTLVTHVVPADSLAALASGTYAVNVAVTTTTAVIGVFAGAVTLPLPHAP